MNIRPLGAELFNSDRQTEGITTLTVVFEILRTRLKHITASIPSYQHGSYEETVTYQTLELKTEKSALSTKSTFAHGSVPITVIRKSLKRTPDSSQKRLHKPFHPRQLCCGRAASIIDKDLLSLSRWGRCVCECVCVSAVVWTQGQDLPKGY